MSDAFFSHPILSAWTADAETATALGWPADLAAMLEFEAALAAAEAGQGIISGAAARAIADVCAGFAPDERALREATRKDGVVVPGLVAQLQAALGPPHAAALHLGATSQDVVDTALMLRLKRLLRCYIDRLAGLRAVLEAAGGRWGERPLMAYTRLRAALPGKVSDRLTVWCAGLDAAMAALERTLAADIALQFAGPVGTLEKLGAAGPAVRADLARRLGLADPMGSWHTERGRIRGIGAALAEASAALGKIGLDCGLMAQDGIDAIELSGGASSSMAHKVNPVDAELLVALARYNAVLLGGLGQAALHEYERSGAGWTLEWAVLPQMLMTTGGALRAAERLLGGVRRIG